MQSVRNHCVQLANTFYFLAFCVWLCYQKQKAIFGLIFFYKNIIFPLPLRTLLTCLLASFFYF
jgi:hypothetical protein